MKVEKVCRIKNNKLRSLTPSAFETGDYEMQLLNVYDEKISTIKGFGGAFTDSAAYNYHLASETVKKQILEQLFGESGLKYNFTSDKPCFTKTFFKTFAYAISSSVV